MYLLTKKCTSFTDLPCRKLNWKSEKKELACKKFIILDLMDFSKMCDNDNDKEIGL